MVFDTKSSYVILIVIDGILLCLLITVLRSLFCETHLQQDLVRCNGLSRLFSTLDSLCASGFVSSCHLEDLAALTLSLHQRALPYI